MSKYIIEIAKEYEEYFKGILICGIADGKFAVDVIAREDLEELNSDYINEHFGDLQDDAYNKGYAQCQDDYGDALKHAKDTAYQKGFEDGKAQREHDDKIEVGDEVEVLNSGNKYLVAWIAGTSLCGFAHDGVTCRLQPSDVRKTGRHFDIASILEDMRND